MPQHNFDCIVLLLPLFSRLISAVSYSITEGGTQFIYYDGTIAGKFTHNSPHLSLCGDGGSYYFGNLVDSSLRIGINPHWDSNPLFFELEHYGNELNSGSSKHQKLSSSDVIHTSGNPTHITGNTLASYPKKDICLNVGGCTYDAIYNLDFASAWYVCEKDGALCGSFELWPWYYVSAEIVNLSTAAIARVSGVPISDMDGEPFYGVRGDEKTWVSNETVQYNNFDFQRPRNYSYLSSERNCVDELRFYWNASTPFTYNLNFTNTSSIALFTLSAPVGNITLSFTGTRLDRDSSDYHPYDNGNYAAIALASSNSSLPHFTFANGSGFEWRQFSDGTWDAQASSGMETPHWGTLWWATLGGIALALFS